MGDAAGPLQQSRRAGLFGQELPCAIRFKGHLHRLALFHHDGLRRFAIGMRAHGGQSPGQDRGAHCQGFAPEA